MWESQDSLEVGVNERNSLVGKRDIYIWFINTRGACLFGREAKRRQ